MGGAVGYEGLLASTGKISPGGGATLVDQEPGLPPRLRKRQVCSRHAPTDFVLRGVTIKGEERLDLCLFDLQMECRWPAPTNGELG